MVTRHPALAPAIALCLGIALGSFVGVGCTIFAMAAVLFLVGFRRLRWMRLVAIAFVGAAVVSFRFEARRADDLRLLVGENAELTRVRGSISIEPERRVLEHDGDARYRTTARVRVSALELEGHWREASGDVAVTTVGFLPEEFVAGSRVEIFGALARPQGAMARGLFDFERHLRRQRVFFVLRAEQAADWTLLEQPTRWGLAPLCRWFNEWGRKTLARGLPSDQNTRLLWSMALGWRPGLTNEISQPFMRTGTLHVFAISGLHIAMMAWILIKTLTGTWMPAWLDARIARKFPRAPTGLSREWAGAIVIPVIWFYAAATGWQASAIRSTIMSSVVIVGWAARRPSNLLNSLSVSALIILLWQPEQLFQAGFQLSFILLLSMAVWPGLIGGAPWPDPTVMLGQKTPGTFERTVAVTLWSKGLARIYEWATRRDALLPEHLRPWWLRKLDGFVSWLLGGINLSIASLVGAGMVVAYYFNLVSLSSVVANLVVVPISGIALGGSMASLALGWLPWAPEFFNWISWLAMFLMVWICEALEKFRWSYFYVEAPSALTMAAYYFCVIAVVTGWAARERWRAAVVALIACATIMMAGWRERVTTEITMLPGAGAVFVDAPGNRSDLLIDCDREQAAVTLVRPFLRSQGVDRLQTVALTHGDVSHVEGFWRLEKEFLPKQIVTSPARSRSPKYKQILEALDPARWRKAGAGESVAGWEILHPRAQEDFGRADDDALVFAKTVAGRRILLLSDLGRAGQRQLIEHGADLRADIVFCGAANDGAMREEFLEALSPKVVVVAGGMEGVSKKLVEQWRRREGVKVLATASERAVSVVVQRDDVFVRPTVGEAVRVE